MSVQYEHYRFAMDVENSDRMETNSFALIQLHNFWINIYSFVTLLHRNDKPDMSIFMAHMMLVIHMFCFPSFSFKVSLESNVLSTCCFRCLSSFFGRIIVVQTQTRLNIERFLCRFAIVCWIQHRDDDVNGLSCGQFYRAIATVDQ